MWYFPIFLGLLNAPFKISYFRMSKNVTWITIFPLCFTEINLLSHISKIQGKRKSWNGCYLCPFCEILSLNTIFGSVLNFQLYFYGVSLPAVAAHITHSQMFFNLGTDIFFLMLPRSTKRESSVLKMDSNFSLSITVLSLNHVPIQMITLSIPVKHLNQTSLLDWVNRLSIVY